MMVSVYFFKHFIVNWQYCNKQHSLAQHYWNQTHIINILDCTTTL